MKSKYLLSPKHHDFGKKNNQQDLQFECNKLKQETPYKYFLDAKKQKQNFSALKNPKIISEQNSNQKNQNQGKKLRVSNYIKDSNKSTQINEQQNESLIKQKKRLISIQDGKQCIKHPHKKAKYQLNDNINEKFCSKCALKFALKGQQVEVLQQQEQDIKKEEIENFLKLLDSTQNQLKSFQEILAIKQSDFQKSNEIQIEKVNFIYTLIQNLLNNEHEKILSQIRQIHEDSSQKLATNMENFQGIQKEINQFQSDIYNNLDSIITEIELSPFQKIIQSYQQKIYHVQKQLCELQSQSIYKLSVEESSQAIENLKINILPEIVIFIKQKQKIMEISSESHVNMKEDCSFENQLQKKRNLIGSQSSQSEIKEKINDKVIQKNFLIEEKNPDQIISPNQLSSQTQQNPSRILEQNQTKEMIQQENQMMQQSSLSNLAKLDQKSRDSKGTDKKDNEQQKGITVYTSILKNLNNKGNGNQNQSQTNIKGYQPSMSQKAQKRINERENLPLSKLVGSGGKQKFLAGRNSLNQKANK